MTQKSRVRVSALVLLVISFLTTMTLFQNCSVGKFNSASEVSTGFNTSNNVSNTSPVTGTAGCQFNASVIQHGQALLAYQDLNVPSSGVCVSQTRTCHNGVLSGSYQYSSCSVNSSGSDPVKKSCSFNGVTVAHGASTLAYQAASVTSPGVCRSEARVCNDGLLGGSYGFTSCSVQAVPVVPPVSGGGARGCVDDPSVPIYYTLDFSSPRAAEFYGEMGTFGTNFDTTPSSYNPSLEVAHTMAIKIVVGSDGGNWRRSGSMNFFSYSGWSDAQGTLSRCRGSFGTAGLVAGLRQPNGQPEQQGDVAFRWDVNVPTPRESASLYGVLYGVGKTDPKDGWVSDGVYYINVRQVACNTSNRCGRRFSASAGVPTDP